VCRTPEKALNKPEYVKLKFVKGLPVELNNKQLDLVEIINQLNKIGAQHAIGIAHHIEDRLVGLKVRGLYEAPAAEIIINAHFNLEKYVSTREENQFKQEIDTKWAYLCYGALWYEPLMDDLNAFIDKINEKVSGLVTIKLFKGMAEVVAVETANSIFDEKLATFMKSSAFNQNASAGFIEIYTLQMRLAQAKERFALLTIGEEKNKKKFLPLIKSLRELGFHFYATQHTHAYLAKQKVKSILLHKMYEGAHPSLEDVLRQNLFDLIINVPYNKQSTDSERDQAIIQEWSIKNNIPLVTEFSTAERLIHKLEKRLIVRKKG